jgi:carboxylesterase
MALRVGAEPFSAAGGRVGVLLCHGFTGSPASMRPWAEQLAAAGFSVEVPLLPGHGTRWQDMQVTRWPDWYAAVDRSLRDLQHSCEQVFVMGLSMGGSLALRLAEEHGDAISGIVVVNPSIHSANRMLVLLPLLRHVVAAVPGVSNDIKLEGRDEIAYDKLPLQSLHSLTKLWRLVRDELPRVTQPLLVFGSEVDHVVEPANGREVVDRVSSDDVQYVVLPDSYHVATLDNDAQTIIDGSLSLIRRLTADVPSTKLKTDGSAS